MDERSTGSGLAQNLLPSARITCPWGTLRPFESSWSLFQKLSAFNYVSTRMINKVACFSERKGRNRRLVIDLIHLAEILGSTPRVLESFDPGYLLGIMDRSRLDIFRSSMLRFCPNCLCKGFHSELFQLRGLILCPEHGCTLLEACPGCRRQIEYDDCLLRAFICRCGFKLSEWTPQKDGDLASERFPKIEASGRTLRTHAALEGRADARLCLAEIQRKYLKRRF